MPELGKVKRLDDIPKDLQIEFSVYHNLLKKADDPDWRQFGIDWLEEPIAWYYDKNKVRHVARRRKDDCDYWPSCSCCCGGRNIRNIPAAKF